MGSVCEYVVWGVCVSTWCGECVCEYMVLAKYMYTQLIEFLETSCTFIVSIKLNTCFLRTQELELNCILRA